MSEQGPHSGDMKQGVNTSDLKLSTLLLQTDLYFGTRHCVLVVVGFASFFSFCLRAIARQKLGPTLILVLRASVFVCVCV